MLEYTQLKNIIQSLRPFSSQNFNSHPQEVDLDLQDIMVNFLNWDWFYYCTLKLDVVYIFGGNDGRGFLDTAEAYDFRMN